MTDNQKNLLKKIAKSHEFDALVALRDDMLKNWHEQTGTGETEWDYLRSSLKRDGKIEGVNALIQTIENMAK